MKSSANTGIIPNSFLSIADTSRFLIFLKSVSLNFKYLAISNASLDVSSFKAIPEPNNDTNLSVISSLVNPLITSNSGASKANIFNAGTSNTSFGINTESLS